MGSEGQEFSESQEKTFKIVLAVASTLSFCGALFACACYVAFRHKRTFGLQLVFFLSLNDVGSQIWVPIQFIREPREEIDSEPPSVLCICESYFIAYFPLSCIMWSSAIAYTLFVTIIRGHQLHEVARRLPYMALLCQGVPLAACVVSHAWGAYGPTALWCWIKPTNPILQFATFYIPCWLCITFNLYVYILVRLRLRALSRKSSHWEQVDSVARPTPPSLSTLGRSNSQWISQTDFEDNTNIFGSITHGAEEGSYIELVDNPLTPQRTATHTTALTRPPSASYHRPSFASQREKFQKLSQRLMVYPMILVLCWSWATADGIRGVFEPDHHWFWLSFLHILFMSLQGLLNSIAYGLTEGIGHEFLARLKGRQLHHS